MEPELRILLLGADNEPGQEFLAACAGRDIDCVPLTSQAVELLRVRRLARMLRRHRPAYVVSLLRPHEVASGSATAERIARLCDEGLRNLASLCAARDLVLVHLSSDMVFAGSREGLFSEDDTPVPATPVGEYFLRAEQSVAAHCPRHILLRTGWIYSDRAGNPFADLQQQLVRGVETLHMPAGPTVFPVSPADVARVLLTMVLQAEHGCADWGSYHYSAREAVPWQDFVQAAVAVTQQLTGRPAPGLVWTEADEQAMSATGAQLGCRRILGTFGVRQRDWQQELERCLAAAFSDRQQTPETQVADSAMDVRE